MPGTSRRPPSTCSPPSRCRPITRSGQHPASSSLRTCRATRWAGPTPWPASSSTTRCAGWTVRRWSTWWTSSSDSPRPRRSGLMAELRDLTATELVAGYRDASFTPVEVTRDVLAAIDTGNGDVNAFVLVDHHSALEDAARSTERWRSGEPLGPGDGVPTSIKDIFYTRGWPTL